MNNLLGEDNDSLEYDDNSEDDDWLPQSVLDAVPQTDAATARRGRREQL